VDEEYPATVTIALINSHLIFEYASKFCAENAAPQDLKQFQLSDKEYDKFVKWVGEQKFSYSTILERNTKDIIEAAKREKYYDELESQLNMLRQKVEQNKSTDMIRFKNEISNALTQQIAFHYGLSEGQAEVSLKSDRALVEAGKVLNAPAEYSKILSVH
jgi:carboxyl-terminal processing protease